MSLFIAHLYAHDSRKNVFEFFKKQEDAEKFCKKMNEDGNFGDSESSSEWIVLSLDEAEICSGIDLEILKEELKIFKTKEA